MTRSGVHISIEVGDNYTHSTVRLEASADGPFTVDLDQGAFFDVREGEIVSRTRARSGGSDERSHLDADLTGVFGQLPVADGAIRPGRAPGVERAEYGVRFYPFVSSVADLRLKCDRSIGSLVIHNRAETRLLWDRATLRDDSSGALRPTDIDQSRIVAHSIGGWRWAFVFRDNARPSSCQVCLPIVASGRLLARTVMFPLVGWFGSLVLVFAAVRLINDQAVVAAVGASWTVSLREWLASERAHQVSLGQALLIVEAASVSAWAAALVWLPGWIVAVVAAAMVASGVALVRTAAGFEYAGKLPSRLASIWGWCSVWLEARRAKKRRRLGVSGFDHQRPDSTTSSESQTSPDS